MAKKKNEDNQANAQVEELEGKYKRALADYQNLEKRVQNEKTQWIQFANKELILQLLPVLDILFLAHAHLEDEGLKLSIQKFLEVLKQQGVEKIETIGQTFDPQTMEVIEVVAGEKDKVVEELRAGFSLHGKIIRPAQVKVGSAKQNQEVN